METALLPGISSVGSTQFNRTSPSRETGDSLSFSDYLSKALQDVQDLQSQAEEGAIRSAMGEENYIHNTMLAFEKANLALQLTIQVRDKIVEAFQELMRIQM